MKVIAIKSQTDREIRKRDPVKCYLFDPRRKEAKVIPEEKIVNTLEVLKKRKQSIPFAYILEDQSGATHNSMFGTVLKGALLSYQLKDHEKEHFSFTIKGNLSSVAEPLLPMETFHYPRLPVELGPPLFTNVTVFNNLIQNVLERTKINLGIAREIESKTVTQSNNPYWFEQRKLRLTASR